MSGAGPRRCRLATSVRRLRTIGRRAVRRAWAPRCDAERCAARTVELICRALTGAAALCSGAGVWLLVSGLLVLVLQASVDLTPTAVARGADLVLLLALVGIGLSATAIYSGLLGVLPAMMVGSRRQLTVNAAAVTLAVLTLTWVVTLGYAVR